MYVNKPAKFCRENEFAFRNGLDPDWRLIRLRAFSKVRERDQR